MTFGWKPLRWVAYSICVSCWGLTACSGDSTSPGDHTPGENSGRDTMAGGDGDGDVPPSGGLSGDGDALLGGGTTGDGDGDFTGTGGLGLLETSMGNAHYQVTTSSVSGVENCSATATAGIGAPAPPSLPDGSGSVSEWGEEVTHGQSASDGSTYVVGCLVTDSGSLSVHLTGPNSSPFAVSTSGRTSIELVGEFSASTGIGTAEVAVRNTETGYVSNDPEYPCSLAFVPGEDGYLASAEFTRFTFVCPRAIRPLDEFGVCETRGTVSVRNC